MTVVPIPDPGLGNTSYLADLGDGSTLELGDLAAGSKLPAGGVIHCGQGQRVMTAASFLRSRGEDGLSVTTAGPGEITAGPAAA